MCPGHKSTWEDGYFGEVRLMLAGCHCIVNSECHLALWGSRVILPAVLITHCNSLPREVEEV